MKKQTIQNLALAISSTILTLLIIEIGFRVKTYLDSRDSLEQLAEEYERPEKGTEVTFGQTIKLSKNPRIIYEFIPELSIQFKGVEVNINEHGFRGKTYPAAKEENTMRIVGIGDSQMFGWGVKDHEPYMTVLEDSINQQCPTQQWEVINTAVPGYNTAMELETLREKGLAYQPDYVIVGFIGNDFTLPNFIRASENYYSLRKSFMLEYFRERQTISRLVQAPRREDGRKFESNPDKVPEEYRDMVGKEAVVKSLEELQGLSLEHDFKVILFISNRSGQLNAKQRLVKSTCERLSFHFFQGNDVWRKYAKKNNVANAHEARFLSKTDRHGSVLYHRAIGQYLSEFIATDAIERQITDCQ